MRYLALRVISLVFPIKEAARATFHHTGKLEGIEPSEDTFGQGDADSDYDQLLERVTPTWIQKAVIFSSIWPCLEEGRTRSQVPALHEIWSLDYKWNLLGFEEREALNRSFSVTHEMATPLEETYAWLQTKLAENLKYASASLSIDARLTGEKLRNMISAFEDWVQSTGEKDYNYEAARDACLVREQEIVNGLSRKLRSELVGPCEGEAGHFGSTCSTMTPCPEGTQCGVVHQQRGMMMKLATFGLTALGIYSALGFAVGYSTAAIVPGQTEGALGLTMFFTSHDHRCVCKPLGCAWSDIHKACVTDALATNSSQQLGLDLTALPLNGFKCLKIQQTCQLQACDDSDFDDDTTSGPDGLMGRIGIRGPNSFNCWSSGSRKNLDMTSGERFQVYALERQRGNSANWLKAPV